MALLLSRMWPSSLFLFIILVWLPYVTHAQSNSTLDPILDFCSRWFSSSVVKGNTLFINGGIETFYDSGLTSDPILGINTYLIKVFMASSWDWKTNITITDEVKPTNPKTGTLPPSLIRGTMFQGPANVSEVFVFGGTTFRGNQSFVGYTPPDANTYPLWSYTYDPSVQSPNQWNQYDLLQPWRPNHGAAAEAVDQNLGFYLNGQIDKGTSPETLHMGNDTTHLDGMLVIDLSNQSAKNISTATITGGGPRVGGALEYIAPVGNKGILVALGGQLSPISSKSNATTGTLLGFDTVDVFDIDSYLQNPDSSGLWYAQSTAGDIPAPRIDFCTVSVSALDNSSHHIYLYGGHDPVQSVNFDDVYVLSLPAFKWTRVNFGKSPRWGHDCHLVGNRQMITLGGNTTNEQCDWESKGVAILDLSTITWGSVYDAYAPQYLVPTAIVSWLGGSPSGGAKIKSPIVGYNNTGLAIVFNTTRTLPSSPANSPSPVTPPSPATPSQSQTATAQHSSHVGVIVGLVISVVAILAILTGLLLWFRSRKRRKAMAPRELDSTEKTEYDIHKHHYELPGIRDKPAELGEQHGHSEAPWEPTTYAVELPGTNVVPGGNPGIPLVRTPSSSKGSQDHFLHE